MQNTPNSKTQSPVLIPDLLFREEVYKVVGAAMEVHKQLGCGFLESVYQEALEYEFKLQGIAYNSQVPISIKYKDITLEKYYLADFVVYAQIIVEIKAAEMIDSSAVSQVINYLKGTGYQLGLLINFGEKSLVWKRIALTRK